MFNVQGLREGLRFPVGDGLKGIKTHSLVDKDVWVGIKQRRRWDSNPRITDLQSVALNHLATPPGYVSYCKISSYDIFISRCEIGTFISNQFRGVHCLYRELSGICQYHSRGSNILF